MVAHSRDPLSPGIDPHPTPDPAPTRTRRPPPELNSRPIPLPADRELARIHLELVYEHGLLAGRNRQ